MLKLEVIRPNTIGVTYSKQFENYSNAEPTIERMVERYADRGWEATELTGSNSTTGSIELTHDDAADILLIQWETV